MRYLFTSKEAKQLDDHAIHVVGFPGLVLMEKAAMSMVSVLMEREKPESGILFVCGTGNNGGDGLAAARMLHQSGFRTAIVVIGSPEKLSEDASRQVALAAACDVPVETEEAIFSARYGVLVDGLFGVGLSREIGGVYKKVIEDMNLSDKKIYAIDIPSGVNGDDGRVMNVAVRADVTVTFGVNKLGLVLSPGCRYAGEIVVADIGYPEVSYQSVENPVYYYELDDLPGVLPMRDPDGHKGIFGHVAVIGGSTNMSGAVLFSAKAAYASGAGLVMMCSTANNREILLSGCPQALFESYDTPDAGWDVEAIDRVIDFADVVVLGPGLGRDERAREMVQYVLVKCKKTIVLDGDGLMVCEQKDLKGAQDLILTPHPKEFASLCQKETGDLKACLRDCVRTFAKKTDCVVVGKDARTIVSDGTSEYVNVSGNAGMGTGGSGDVLTGVIAAFIAQGSSSFEAAKAGVYVHGLAGDYYAESKNPYSLTAMEIIDSFQYIL